MSVLLAENIVQADVL